MGYGYSTDKFRVGWVRTPEGDKDKRTVLQASDTVGELRFDMVLRTTVDECAATYDPVKVSMRSIEIKKGATVNVLCWYDKWAYCEFKIDKKLSWGFMYANMLSTEPIAKPAPELRTNGESMKTVFKDVATKTPGINIGLFSGPGENYLRADAGGAHVRPTDKCHILGQEGDWVLVRAATDAGSRYGYIPYAALPDRAKLKDLSFDCVACATSEAVELRDAPDQAGALLMNLPAGAQVSFLAYPDSSHSYAYVEYKTDAIRARGFIPANAVQ